ncbi:MAG: PHP domain-containing protein [Coriobacteriia bacterium]|nr:PHP domain-containing protein [Coriobacteriia bacterium]MCL2746779.1 PHP domain-containing protein [Coriobacteriia bacterium]MCL2870715.1 PHP domain-containing protein [Coriobacteriia bacterium]
MKHEQEKCIKADLHVHTVGSGHGFSTVKENADAAIEKGMELIAITDHGPSVPQGAHNWYFWNLNHVPGIYKGLTILRGCEANIIPDGNPYESRWGIDVADIVARRLDYVTIGFHPTTGFDEGDEDKNTAALIKAMQSPYVDQFNHPGNLIEFPLDVDAVIAAAIEYNVVLELNNSSLNPLGARAGSKMLEIEFAAKAYTAGATLSINSDAHHSTGIGNVEPALSYAKEYGIPIDAFLNTDAKRVIKHIKTKRDRPLLSTCQEKTEPHDEAKTSTPQ